MDFPKIDLSLLPDLDILTGLFGSFSVGPGHDDTVVILATFVYDTVSSGGIV